MIIAFFTNQGTPATGLTPTIDIWESDGTQVVSGATMTEVGGGFYKYDFTDYDGSKHYCIRADGGPTLPTDERYQYGTNEYALVWEEAVNDHQTSGTFGEKVSALALESTVQAIKQAVDFIKGIEGGRWKIENNQMIFYDEDNSTELARFDLFDKDGNPSEENVYERRRV